MADVRRGWLDGRTNQDRRFDGPARHIVIRPTLPWRQLAVMALVAAIIGFWLAVGHS